MQVQPIYQPDGLQVKHVGNVLYADEQFNTTGEKKQNSNHDLVKFVFSYSTKQVISSQQEKNMIQIINWWFSPEL